MFSLIIEKSKYLALDEGSNVIHIVIPYEFDFLKRYLHIRCTVMCAKFHIQDLRMLNNPDLWFTSKGFILMRLLALIFKGIDSMLI